MLQVSSDLPGIAKPPAEPDISRQDAKPQIRGGRSRPSLPRASGPSPLGEADFFSLAPLRLGVSNQPQVSRERTNAKAPSRSPVPFPSPRLRVSARTRPAPGPAPPATRK